LLIVHVTELIDFTKP